MSDIKKSKRDELNKIVMISYNGKYTPLEGRRIALMGDRTEYTEIGGALVYYQIDHPAAAQIALPTLKDTIKIIDDNAGLLVGEGYKIDVSKSIYYGAEYKTLSIDLSTDKSTTTYYTRNNRTYKPLTTKVWIDPVHGAMPQMALPGAADLTVHVIAEAETGTETASYISNSDNQLSYADLLVMADKHISAAIA